MFPTSAPAIIIIIMGICKAPTLQLKAPNKHSITHTMDISRKTTHTMYTEMEVLSSLSAIKRYIYIGKK